MRAFFLFRPSFNPPHLFSERECEQAFMDPANLTMIVILIFLVICSAFFSATETAFTSLNQLRLKAKADNGDKRAARTLRLAGDYDNLISTILVGNNIVNIVATTLSTLLFVEGLKLQNGALVSTVVMTVVVLIFGEVSPKTIAKDIAEPFAMFATPIIRVFMVLLRPVTAFLSLIQRGLKKLIHPAESGITEEELAAMVEQAESEGGLDEHESELIRSAIEFGDMEVQEILTPRVDVVAVEDTVTEEELARAFAESGYSRLPVYHEDVDDIIGVIHEKDFYVARFRGRFDMKALTTAVLYTTGNTKISDLLRILQHKKAHMVVVVDEYGGTEGICTLEDIVEELVGEIWDEHDEIIEDFKKQEDGSYLIACHAALDDLYEMFSLTGECEANTVSGWVLEQVGRIPEEGDSFRADGLEVAVTKVDHRRVLEIRVVVLPQEENEDKEK